MQSSSASSLVRASTLLLAALAGASGAHASTLYWGQSTFPSGWSTSANWYTDADGTTVSSAAPTATDDVVFNTTGNNTIGGTVTLSTATIAANSLTFNTSAGITISQNTSGTRTLGLGSGGITVNSGAGTTFVGVSSGSLFVEATANQIWANNAANGLSVRRLRASDAATGDVTVTLSANSSGSIGFSNSIGDSPDGTKKLSIVIDSAGTGTVSLLAATSGGTWSGGTTVKRGTLLTSAATVGIGDIKLGDTSGAADATFRINTTTAITTNLVVQSGSTGTKTLEFVANNSAGGTYSGGITLDGDLTLGVRNMAGGATLNGAISGAGNLIKGQYQGSNSTGMLTLGGVNTFSGNTVVSVGSLTLADNAALTFYIGADGVSNKVSGAGTNAATFAGDFIFNLTGASLVDGNSWQIVDVGTLNESFASTFLVQGFTETDNVWTNGTGLSFSEATGMLSYTASAIPEPSAFAAFAGLGALGCGVLRRRRARA